jgi:hypothetical protein
MTDVFHTLFGVAGLSLLGYPGLEDVDPIYCMPASLIERMGLKKSWKATAARGMTATTRKLYTTPEPEGLLILLLRLDAARRVIVTL